MALVLRWPHMYGYSLLQGERWHGSFIQLKEQVEVRAQHIRIREMCQVRQASTQDSLACLACWGRVRYVYLGPASRLMLVGVGWEM